LTGIFKNSAAQKFYVYESDSFNVLLKCNQEGSKVLEISVSDQSKTKWIKYKIAEAENKSQNPNSTKYTVFDGKSKLFNIEYFRYSDYILVEKTENEQIKTLYKRSIQ
jgi:hypothetical protein